MPHMAWQKKDRPLQYPTHSYRCHLDRISNLKIIKDLTQLNFIIDYHRSIAFYRYICNIIFKIKETHIHISNTKIDHNIKNKASLTIIKIHDTSLYLFRPQWRKLIIKIIAVFINYTNIWSLNNTFSIEKWFAEEIKVFPWTWYLQNAVGRDYLCSWVWTLTNDVSCCLFSATRY